VTSGDGDQYIEGTNCSTSPADGQECNEAWQALRAALMVSGDPDDTGSDALMTHPFGGVIWLWCSERTPTGDIACDTNVDFGATIGDRNYIGVSNLEAGIAQVIDQKFDDGDADSGALRGSATYTDDLDAIVSIYYALGD
jgi:hypothetical protein